MNPGEVILWMADNIPTWRPFAIALIGGLYVIGLLVAYEGLKRA